MGGMYLQKEFNSLEELMQFLQEQVAKAKDCGLYLQLCYFEEVLLKPGTYKLTGYFSK